MFYLPGYNHYVFNQAGCPLSIMLPSLPVYPPLSAQEAILHLLLNKLSAYPHTDMGHFLLLYPMVSSISYQIFSDNLWFYIKKYLFNSSFLFPYCQQQPETWYLQNTTHHIHQSKIFLFSSSILTASFTRLTTISSRIYSSRFIFHHSFYNKFVII